MFMKPTKFSEYNYSVLSRIGHTQELPYFFLPCQFCAPKPIANHAFIVKPFSLTPKEC